MNDLKMDLIIWDNSFSVGNIHIDRQHKIMISLINDLLKAYKDNVEFDKLGNILGGMKEYTQTHFKNEEEILLQSKYPGYDRQRELHEEFTITVNEIYNNFLNGSVDIKEILKILRNWWTNHILKEDKEYSSYIVDYIDAEIDESERHYTDAMNSGLKDISFTFGELRIFQEVSRLFNENKNSIIDNWMIEEGDNYHRYPVLRQGIETLLDDFIDCFKESNIVKYLDRNEILGRMVASEDIPYYVFMRSFQHWENSYGNILERAYGKDFVRILSVLDTLHHTTISILANQYFNVRDATIFALAKLAESRDPDTGQHLMRTREYSRILARELGCGDNFVDYMYKMSPLHDIGKVGVPDNILLKPGKLDKAEFTIMKRHTEIGGRTLQEIVGTYKVIKGSLAIAEEVANYHHEKYDGSGYHGLKGQQIPLSARIFTIGDIYDALTSKRCYKDAFTHDQSCDIILEGDGRTAPEHFDPKVLDAFEKNRQEFHKVSQRYKDDITLELKS
ncbi:MAG: bacteriohemerythrin [Candidatus Scalindua sp.]